MIPKRHLMIFTTVLVGIALSTVLVVAYGQNYSATGGGHAHGSEKPKDGGGQSRNIDRPATMEHDAPSKSHDDHQHPQKDESRKNVVNSKGSMDSEHKDHPHKAQSTSELAPASSGKASIYAGTAPAHSFSKRVYSSAVSGSPGVSHLYHVGAKDFFLDQQHIVTLSNEQQTALQRIKSQAFAISTDARRQMRDGERELWKVTSADHPNTGAIEQKVRNIERERFVLRRSFIRLVGEAALVLTAQQRSAIIGTDAAPMQASALPPSEHHPD